MQAAKVIPKALDDILDPPRSVVAPSVSTPTLVDSTKATGITSAVTLVGVDGIAVELEFADGFDALDLDS